MDTASYATTSRPVTVHLPATFGPSHSQAPRAVMSVSRRTRTINGAGLVRDPIVGMLPTAPSGPSSWSPPV